MLIAVPIDAQGGDQHQVVANMQASIWTIRRSSLDKSDAIHLASRVTDSAMNRREAADLEVPSPVIAGRSPSGSRTARLSLRVDTLISNRFMAQRPSQSSAQAAVQIGSAIS